MKASGAERKSAVAVKRERKLISTSSAFTSRMSRKKTIAIVRKRRIPFFWTLIGPAVGVLFSRDDSVLLFVFKLVGLSVNVIA
jgi:hypothetical protein